MERRRRILEQRMYEGDDGLDLFNLDDDDDENPPPKQFKWCIVVQMYFYISILMTDQFNSDFPKYIEQISNSINSITKDSSIQEINEFN